MSSSINDSYVPAIRFPRFVGDWSERVLGDSFEARTEKNRDDLPLLSLGEDGLVLQSETERKDNSNADKSKYLRVSVGDIAYNTMRMWQGRCVYADIEGIVSPAYTVCKPKEGIDSLFHYYLFKTKKMVDLFHQNSQGLVSDTLNLKFEAFSRIKYALPPSVAEQKKIASCLSKMDEMIDVQERKVDTLKAQKKGLMQQLFPLPGETTPQLRFQGFSEEWTELKIEIVFDLRNGYTPSKSEESFWSGGTIPWFRMDDIRENGHVLSDSAQHITESAVKGSKLFDANTIIVATSATIGEHALIKVKHLANQRFVNLSIKDAYLSKTDIEYAYQFMYIIDEICKSKVNVGAFASISTEAFSGLPYLMPSPEEQRMITGCLSAIDDVIDLEEKKSKALKQYKKGLVQKLFPL